MMFEEMMHMSGESGDPVAILMAASIVRDDAPWLYELAMEVDRAVRVGDPETIQHEIKRLRNFSEFALRGPFMEEFRFVGKESHMFLMEFPRMLEHMLRRTLQERKATEPEPKVGHAFRECHPSELRPARKPLRFLRHFIAWGPMLSSLGDVANTMFSCYTVFVSPTTGLRNVTVTLEEEVAQWARIEAARRDTSVSRLLGELLKERMSTQDGYERAMKRALGRKPFLRSRGRYLTREEAHDRARLR